MPHALLKSINTLPAKPLLSMDNFHFSSLDIRAVCVLYPFLYSHKWDGKCLSIYSKICFCIILSQILDMTGRTLTSLKFFNNETSSFLNAGVTSASLRLSGKHFCVIISDIYHVHIA